jgi:hypothetical protein
VRESTKTYNSTKNIVKQVTKDQERRIDDVYFEGHPYLHAEDKFTGFSACVSLIDRSISTQVAALKWIWIAQCVNPSHITADAE